MAILKYSQPDTDIFGKRFSDIMDEFFNDAVATRQGSFSPKINISENEKQFMIDVEVPGMDKNDIDVSLENRQLTISGKRKFDNEEKDTRYHRVETHFGSFTRSFRLPDSVDEGSINAKYNNGILSITIDKSEEQMKRQISIK